MRCAATTRRQMAELRSQPNPRSKVMDRKPANGSEKEANKRHSGRLIVLSILNESMYSTM